MSKLIDTNSIRNTILILKMNPNVSTEPLIKHLEEALDRAERANLETNFSKTIGSLIPARLKNGSLQGASWEFIGTSLIENFTWDSIDDVPGNLTVIDRFGYTIRYIDGHWRLLSGLEVTRILSTEELANAAPFTLFYNAKQ